MGCLAYLEEKEQLEMMEIWEKEDPRGCQDCQVTLECLVNKDQKVRRVEEGILDHLVLMLGHLRMGNLVKMLLMVDKENLELLETKGLLACLENQDCLVKKDSEEIQSRALLVLWAKKDHQDFLAPWEDLDMLVIKVPLVKRDRKENWG